MSLFNLFKPKKFDFYVLSCDLYPDVVLTITTSRDEAVEFYSNFLREKHRHTFEPWCADRNLDAKSADAWKLYYAQNVSTAESGQYKIVKIPFGKKEIAAILRAFSNTPLIGCSYETEFDLILRIDQEKYNGVE